MKAVLRLDGSNTSLIQHNERLSDPLDPFARSLSEISGKRKKTDADHLEMARREFLGGLYMNDNGPCIPAWNILRCLQEGAKRHKRGADVLRGVMPLVETVDLLYDGPRTPEDLWKQRETFSLRKGVGVAGRKVMRTRPIFSGWAAELPVEIDPVIFDFDAIQNVWADAGLYAGLGDMRPVYGRFEASALTDEQWLKQCDGNIESLWANNAASIKRVISSDNGRRGRH